MNSLDKLLNNKSQNYKRVVTALILFTLFFGFFMWGTIPFCVLLAGVFLLALREWKRMARTLSHGKLKLWRTLGYAYITTGFIGITLLVFYDRSLFILVLTIIWTTDICAYFMGRALKGPKLAPSISPGKTWSGALSGIAASLVTGALVAYYGFDMPLSFFSLSIFMLISSISILGDLLESLIKRKLGLKDSGSLLPGHGGILDRIDSILVIGCILFLAFSLPHLISPLYPLFSSSSLPLFKKSNEENFHFRENNPLK